MADTYALKRIVSIILLGRLGYYRWLSDASRLVSIIGKIIAWSLPVGAPTLDMILREVTVINQVLRDAILYQYQVVDVEITRISTKYKLEGIQWELGCKLHQPQQDRVPDTAHQHCLPTDSYWCWHSR